MRSIIVYIFITIALFLTACGSSSTPSETIALEDRVVAPTPAEVDIVAQNTGVGIIDLYSVLSSRKELFPDTVHPDPEGANIIAQTVYSSIY